MPFTLPNTEQSVFNPGTQPWQTDSPPLDWLLNTLFPRDPASGIQGVMGAGIGGPSNRTAAVAKLAAKKATGPLVGSPLAKALEGQKLGLLEQLIVDRGESGTPMMLDSFRPRLTQKATGRTLLGGQGGHHADLYEQIPRNSSVRDWEHGFATPEGHPVSDELTYLLTGPPELLKQASQMVKSGTTLDTLTQTIKDAIANMGGRGYADTQFLTPQELLRK